MRLYERIIPASENKKYRSGLMLEVHVPFSQDLGRSLPMSLRAEGGDTFSMTRPHLKLFLASRNGASQRQEAFLPATFSRLRITTSQRTASSSVTTFGGNIFIEALHGRREKSEAPSFARHLLDHRNLLPVLP
jgi:hypothetical protein